MASPMEVRRFVLRVLLGATVLAGGVGALALVRGDLTDADWKVIVTSLLFALATTLGAAGVALADRRTTWARGIGGATVLAAGLAFVMTVGGLWAEPDDADGFWRATLCFGILAFEGAHACFVLARARSTDSEAVRAATIVALAGTVSSSILTVVPLALDTQDPDEGYAKLLGVILIAQVVATLVATLGRRLAAEPELSQLEPEDPVARLRREVSATADRIERLTPDAQVSAECRYLRQLARDTGA